MSAVEGAVSTAMRSTATSTEEYKAIVRTWVETAWNQGDLTSAAILYAANYIYQDPTSTVYGPEGIKQLVALYRSALPDLHFVIKDLIAEGDSVVWRYVATGTQHGPLPGIPATGKRVEVTGVVISRFQDGKWAEDWHVQDTLGMLQQLGVIPLLA